MMRLRHTEGFALPAVIFMMVVVTLLIAYMARIQTTESALTDMRMLGGRVYWAAQAGAEWAAYEVNANNNCGSATGTLNIDGFQVNVDCHSNIYTEGGGMVTVYEITVLATSSVAVASHEYVSRKLTLVLNVES